jgi:hypothetical protein
MASIQLERPDWPAIFRDIERSKHSNAHGKKALKEKNIVQDSSRSKKK